MAHPKYRGTYLHIRKAWAPVVARGEATCHEPICLMPRRHIAPGTRWDLSHDANTGAILGPSHPLCNRSEGGKRGRAKQDQRFLRL